MRGIGRMESGILWQESRDRRSRNVSWDIGRLNFAWVGFVFKQWKCTM